MVAVLEHIARRHPCLIADKMAAAADQHCPCSTSSASEPGPCQSCRRCSRYSGSASPVDGNAKGNRNNLMAWLVANSEVVKLAVIACFTRSSIAIMFEYIR